ncbi:MAG: DUF4956 domain-containing protein [Gemmatimonadota bacterium]
MTETGEKVVREDQFGVTEEGRYPLAQPPTPRGSVEQLVRSPLFRLCIYYLVVLTVAAILVREVPLARNALVTPAVPVLGEGAALLSGEAAPSSWTQPSALLETTVNRVLTTLFIIIGAVTLAIPVAWIYMLTKKLRYDPGLVRSVVILPIAVAGILLVVKNSLALAFSLAGIVAAVRFRNTLKDPRDAVFIFLTIAIGISAGVQALDIALVVSVSFNIAVLALWKFQVGSIYGGRYGRTGVLSIGDSSLLVAQTPQACRSLRRQLLGRVGDMKTDGILLIHTTEPELARHTVQDALTDTSRDWRLLGISSRGDEVHTAEYLVRLRKKLTPADLIGALDEWSAHIMAAEYVPFRQRSRARDDGSEEKGDGDDDGGKDASK